MIDLRLGDCLDVLPNLPDASVQCCITSPPYWGLRDYGTTAWEGGDAECDHKVGRFTTPVSDKQRSNHGSGDVQARDVCPKCGAIRIDAQLGLEPTPDEYVANLVAVFREVRRILRDDGTLWLNLGDSYCSMKSRYNQKAQSLNGGKPQDNVFSGNKTDLYHHRELGLKDKDLVGIPWRVAFALQADGWWLRQDIIWHKPNPMPESVTDRCTKSHEYIFLLTKSARYYYDNEAVKEPSAMVPQSRNTNGRGDKDIGYAAHRKCPGMTSPTARNRRDVWTIATQPYREAHFATFPEKLVEPCILAGSKPGDVILDPFNGAGTVGVVATRLGRDYIGVELNAGYIEMTERRIAQVQPALVMA